MVLGALHKPSKIQFRIEIGGFNSSEKELQVKKKNNQPTNPTQRTPVTGNSHI